MRSDNRREFVTTPALQQQPTPVRFFNAINAYELSEAINTVLELPVTLTLSRNSRAFRKTRASFGSSLPCQKSA